MRLNSITDIGIKRKENQDNYWSALLRRDGNDAGILCVCDGMGGLDNGQLASKIAVEYIRDSIKEGTPFRDLEDVVKQANKVIYEMSKSGSCKMGTTCTIVQCCNGTYEIFHVGDSRCYRVHKDSFQSLTKDHSVVKEYNLSREKNEEAWRKYKNALTRCLGVEDSVRVDYYSGSYEDGDIFFVCSDGLWHYLESYSIEPADLNNLQFFVQRCIGAGETDNITCSVLYL